MRLAFALVVLAACDSSPPSTCSNGVLVVTTDFTATQIGSLVLQSDAGPPSLLSGSQLGADPALATSNGRHFLIARDLDMIFEVDLCGRGLQQFSAVTLGDSHADPQDVAAASDGSKWVTRLLLPSLLVAGTKVTAIDLSQFDTDGIPDMSGVSIVGNNAFVALERLNPYPTSTQPSQMLVLDTTSLSLVKQITLAGRNPFGHMPESGGKIYVAEPGNFTSASETDAGIEVVDTQALTSKLLYSETALGGSAAAVAVSSTCGAAIVAGATTAAKDNSTTLVTFPLDGSSPPTPSISSSSFDLRGLLFTSDAQLIVGDKRGTPNGFPVHTFSVGPNCALTSAGADSFVTLMPALAFSN